LKVTKRLKTNDVRRTETKDWKNNFSFRLLLATIDLSHVAVSGLLVLKITCQYKYTKE